MSELESELQAAAVSAVRFLESLVVTDLDSPGLVRVREGEMVYPLPTNIPFRVEVARYLVDLALHYGRKPE